MYCSQCGKQMPDDVNFCPHCGSSKEGTPQRGAGNSLFKWLKPEKWLSQETNFDQILNLFSVAVLGLQIILRFTNQETVTVVNFLAQDDYLVVSGGARTAMIVFSVLHALLAVTLFVRGKSKHRPIRIPTFVLAVLVILLNILLITVRFPAPY